MIKKMYILIVVFLGVGCEFKKGGYYPSKSKSMSIENNTFISLINYQNNHIGWLEYSRYYANEYYIDTNKIYLVLNKEYEFEKMNMWSYKTDDYNIYFFDKKKLRSIIDEDYLGSVIYNSQKRVEISIDLLKFPMYSNDRTIKIVPSTSPNRPHL